MSSIKTTQIDGDVSVGRNVHAGGKAEIEGSLTVGHNVKIKGWLEAPNIKGCLKGIFPDLATLVTTYPDPQIGWLAGVGTSIPCAAYMCSDGESWEATGGTINLNFDASQFIEDANQLNEDVAALEAKVLDDVDTGSGSVDLLAHDESVLATIPGATSESAGVMSAADKAKVDDIEKTYATQSALVAGLLNAINSSKPVGVEYGANELRIVDVNGNTLITIYGASCSDEESESFPDGRIGLLTAEDKERLDTLATTYLKKADAESDYLKKDDAASAYVKQDRVGVADGIAPLNANGKVDPQYIEGGDIPASIFNATIEVPLTGGGYYVLCDADHPVFSAVHAAWSQGKQVSGLIISFEIAAGIWKTYQYVGREVTEVSWKNSDNWQDFGSLAAGSETYIVIDGLCGPPSLGSYYTLQSAVERLIAYQNQTGVTYAKQGLIISYGVGENTMETKQFQGQVTDFSEIGLWKDFGGGGSSDLVASDEPESGGEDAFSTGGAYSHLPVGAVQVESEDEDKLAYSLVNADGDTLGDPFLIPKGGGGSSSGKVFNINFQQSPLYAAAGGEFIVRAAIRSVTTDGQTELTEAIDRIDIIDRDTSQVLYSNSNVNRPSSSSSTNYSFSFDLSGFFTEASSRRLQLIAYDASGDRATRTINVVAVDVTLECTQVLNYTTQSVVFTTDTSKSLPLYKFPNNQGSIRVKTEILLPASVTGEEENGWYTLGEATVSDSYSHNISVNAHNVCGYVLPHGSYLLRVQGTDVESQVRGNMVYTTLMVVDVNSDVPLCAIRFNDSGDGTIRRYDTLSIEVAGYSRSSNETVVSLEKDGSEVGSWTLGRSRVQTYVEQVSGLSDGTVLRYMAVTGSSESGEVSVTVSGSVIDATLTGGSIYDFDFANRTNNGSHDIVSGQGDAFRITLTGANWSSNGFGRYLGSNCLAIKEDVTGVLNHAPFSATSGIESSGFALLFAFAVDNVADVNAHLLECYDPQSGAGFYVTGNVVGISCLSGTPSVVERGYSPGERVTVGIVVEPGSRYLERDGIRYSMMKLFLNGEEAGCLGYVPGGSNLIQPNNIRFDGHGGDFYLYYMLGWAQRVEWQQSFYDYLVKLTDSAQMVSEYDFEGVYQGNTQHGPSASLLYERGMPYVLEQPYNGSNIEALDATTSTKEKVYVTLTYRDPSRPWRDFVATDVQKRNQGTTSAKRPVKNPRYYLGKSKGSSYDKTTRTGGTVLTALHTREEIVAMGYDGGLWDEASALFSLNKVRVGEGTIPVDIITIKVDYSDSSNANDSGVCNIMNATYRALGSGYMTPAQRYYDGTWAGGSGAGAVSFSGLLLNHSTANHPIALYRDPSGLGTSMYFHAKGSWKEDKNEQVALGFKDTPGYNKGCLNYQDDDFVEYFGTSSETLAQTVTRFLADSSKDTSKVYLISMYCGSSYKFYRYVDGAWTDTTGSMRQVDGEWVITGDVLNPVDGFELLAYQGMCWFKGVGSVSDMMAATTSKSSWVQKLVESGDVSASTFPAWTQFFECMVDNDQLQIDYAMGKKVPYWLYRFLVFCNSCDYDTNDPSVLAARMQLWHDDLYKYANPRALMVYDACTDYLALTDQQAKNMQPMFFLDEGGEVINGVYTSETNVRMYPNKVYDADTANGKDNDGGATVDPEVDPNKPSDPVTGYANPYAGYGSILWNDIYRQPTVIDSDGVSEVNMRTVVSAMRSVQATIDGVTIYPFSPEGAKLFFIDKIVKKWQKTVSSYDGERKYISFTPSSDALYFYALHGLRLTALPSFIDKRFRIRDGFYQTGLFFTGSVFSARIACGANAKITIKAAKAGYFGVGNDASGNLRESCYLEAGESYAFTGFDHTEGTLLYMYQCDRISEIDFSEISLSNAADLSKFSIAEKILLGGAGHSELSIQNYAHLTSLSLSLPFLRELDLRGTSVTSADLSGCPRLDTLLATNTSLAVVVFAETAPVRVAALPSTLSSLTMVGLPNLKYATGCLEISSLSNLSRLHVDRCPQIDGARLLTDALSAGAHISQIRLAGIDVTGSSTTLSSLVGAQGLDERGEVISEEGRCSGLSGYWTMSDLIEDSTVATYDAYFPNLTVLNSQYTAMSFDEDTTYDANMTNLDNGTYAGDGLSGYIPSGHITRLQGLLHVYEGSYDSLNNKMIITQVSDTDLTRLADDSRATDLTGSGGSDIFLRLPHYWYKGINDFLGKKKYLLLSTSDTEPRSTARNVRRTTADQLVLRSACSIGTSAFSVGDTLDTSLFGTDVLSEVCSFDVSGMRQVRWPATGGKAALFLDEDDVVLSIVNVTITYTNNDFNDGDYVFTSIPDGAVRFVFTTPINNTSDVIGVDSSAVEAIEPDWVEHEEELIGVYKASVDSSTRLRSVSGANVKSGTGTQQTSAGWSYDSNGDPSISVAPSNMYYTYKDFQNLSRLRGRGYQLVDYETHKDVANLWMAIHGRRHSQAVNGVGTASRTSTGGTNTALHLADTITGRPRTLGLEDWWGNVNEFMDNVAVNVASYNAFYKNACVAPSGSVVNEVWHIRMADGTERSVLGISSTNEEICRVRWGRYCDVVPSRTVNNTSYNTFFCDRQDYAGSTGRVVCRSGDSANSYNGLVFVFASSASSYSYSSSGARLAFKGEIEIS